MSTQSTARTLAIVGLVASAIAVVIVLAGRHSIAAAIPAVLTAGAAGVLLGLGGHSQPTRVSAGRLGFAAVICGAAMVVGLAVAAFGRSGPSWLVGGALALVAIGVFAVIWRAREGSAAQ